VSKTSPSKPAKKCMNGGARVALSVGDAVQGSVICSYCGKLLKVRVPSNDVNEATLPHHNEAAR
jgi:hypothetical protein